MVGNQLIRRADLCTSECESFCFQAALSLESDIFDRLISRFCRYLTGLILFFSA